MILSAVLWLAGCGEASDAMNVKDWTDNDTSVMEGDGSNGAGNGTAGEGQNEAGQGTGSSKGSSDGTVAGEEAGGSSGAGNEGSGGNVSEGESRGEQDVVAVSTAAVNALNPEELFTDRDFRSDYSEMEGVEITLSGASAQCSSKSVSVSDGAVTIVEEGLYLLSGTLQEGMVIIDAPENDKVWLVLADASISNSINAAIYVKSADKVFITLASGTSNKLENGGSYEELDGNHIDGVVFAKCDLTINGSGSLEVNAEEGHGIVTKDDLKVTGGSLAITAAGHGLSGKDSVCIAEGTLAIQSGKDGIHSEHDTNTEKGNVYIKDGSFTITAGGDGISAGKYLQVDGGSFTIVTGGGSSNKTIARDENGDTVSAKGIKGGEAVVVNGGVFVMDNQDDALHSNDAIMIQGGEFQIATGDDGFHADEDMTVAGGYIDISVSYEGIEGNNVNISGGVIRLYASDDGINAAGGNDQSGFGGFFGRDSFGGGTDSALLISGGTVYVNADGDGVDSNGALTVTGGELYISGPVNSGNGALDYESKGEITGGTVVAVGNSGMAMNFGNTSTQGSAMITIPDQAAGTEITVKDEEGKVLISYTAEKRFNSIVFSCPEMALGGTYTVLAGENEQSVTLESLIYGDGFGGFGGHGGGRGGFGGSGGGGRGQGGPGGTEGNDGRGGAGNPGGPEGEGSFRDPGESGGEGGFGSPGSPEGEGSFRDPGEFGGEGGFGSPGRPEGEGGFGDPGESGGEGGFGGPGRPEGEGGFRGPGGVGMEGGFGDPGES